MAKTLVIPDEMDIRVTNAQYRVILEFPHSGYRLTKPLELAFLDMGEDSPTRYRFQHTLPSTQQNDKTALIEGIGDTEEKAERDFRNIFLNRAIPLLGKRVLSEKERLQKRYLESILVVGN